MKKGTLITKGRIWIILSIIATIVYAIVSKGNINSFMIVIIFFVVGGFLIIFGALERMNFSRIFAKLYKIEKTEGHSEAYIKEYLNVIDRVSKVKKGNIETLQLTLTSIYYDKGQTVNARTLFESISVDTIFELAKHQGFGYLTTAYYNNGLLLYVQDRFIDKADAIFIAGKETIDIYMDKNSDLMTLVIFKNYLLYYLMKENKEMADEMAERIKTHIIFPKQKSAGISIALAKYYKYIGDLENTNKELELTKEYMENEKSPSEIIQLQIREIENI